MDQRIKQLLDDARKALREDREKIELLEILVKHPGWEVYLGILRAKLQMFSEQILAPAGSQDGLVVQEYVKGTMCGLIIARDIAAVTIAGKDQLKQPVGEEEDVDESA